MAKAEIQHGTAQVEMEIAIDAPRERVWRALVAEIGVWWRKDFLSPLARAFRLEPRPGGRLYEDWGHEQGRLWYTVVGIESPRKLQLAGAFMPDDCGGSFGTSHLTLTLEDADRGTTLKLSDHIVGGLRDDLASDLTSGWQTLFRDALKPHVESSTVT